MHNWIIREDPVGKRHVLLVENHPIGLPDHVILRHEALVEHVGQHARGIFVHERFLNVSACLHVRYGPVQGLHPDLLALRVVRSYGTEESDESRVRPARFVVEVAI